ncbi:MAG TPA: hypothetical protein VM733_04230, partial [Thermoanaerobaculia bacterium]|nr:hypothetical protein [Thermoanaerobaculia bacterium]
ITHHSSLVLIVVLAASIFLPALVQGRVFTLRDHFDYFQPLRWFTASELQAGRVPLWNPYNASGEPWLANPQTGVFYPPAWLFVVLPFATAYVLFLLFHVALLGCGAYRLFARDASPGAALIGAVALMFCGPVLSLLDVSNNLATLAWIPWAMWCAACGYSKRGGVALAMAFLGGEPFFAACAAVLYVGRALARPDGLKPVVRSGLRPVVHTPLVALGLSAVQLFPFLEMLRASDRAARLDPSLILMHSMSWSDWLRFVIPVARGATQQFLPHVYVGVVICALALLGIRKTTWPWLVLLAVSVVIACGPSVLAKMPLTLFRYPARMVVLAAFAVIALAVSGSDRVRPEKRWLDLVIVLIVVADLVPRAFALLPSAPFRTDVVPYAKEIGADAKFLRVGAIDANHRRPWISGYLNLYDRRFDAFTAAPVASDAYVRMHRQLLEHPSRQELARKGIGWVITRHDLAPAFAPAARADDVTVYRNSMTLPMAFLTTRSPLTVHRAHARFDTSHVRVSVNAPKEGVLVVLQQRAPGWRVTIDGVETREFPIDRFFRGIQVTRGPHEVVWTYRPRSLFFGAMVTFITLLLLFVKRAR